MKKRIVLEFEGEQQGFKNIDLLKKAMVLVSTQAGLKCDIYIEDYDDSSDIWLRSKQHV